MKKITYLFLFLFVPFLLNAQIVTTNPAFLTDKVAAEIIFDATGTGLDNYQGTNVYAHTGVITVMSVSDNDWNKDK